MMVSPLLVQQLRTKYVLCDSDFSSSIWEQQQQQQQSTINNKKNNSNQQPTQNNNPQKSTTNNHPPKESRKKSQVFLFFPMVKNLLIDGPGTNIKTKAETSSGDIQCDDQFLWVRGELSWVFPKIGVFPPRWMVYNGNPY